MTAQQIQRRTFLKRVGAALAGLVVGVVGGSQRSKVLAQESEYPPDETCEKVFQEADQFEPARIFEFPECLYSVSKNMSGNIQVEEANPLECEDPYMGGPCVTLKTIHVLEMTVNSNGQPCDSDVSAKFFEGDFKAQLNFTYVEDGNQRGYHRGRFEWAYNDTVVIGMMSGITNAGTHRRPVSSCESCEAFGHWEGQLEGFVVEGEMAGCCLRGAYMVTFDPTGEGGDGAVGLALEGLLFCRCG